MAYNTKEFDKEAYLKYIKEAKIDYDSIADYYDKHPEKRTISPISTKEIPALIVCDILAFIILIIAVVAGTNLFLFALTIFFSVIFFAASFALISDSLRYNKQIKKFQNRKE